MQTAITRPYHLQRSTGSKDFGGQGTILPLTCTAPSA
jgi:hypothetical protein